MSEETSEEWFKNAKLKMPDEAGYSPEYLRGVAACREAWMALIKDNFRAMPEFTDAVGFVEAMREHIQNNADAALARAMHHFEREKNLTAASAVRQFMGQGAR